MSNITIYYGKPLDLPLHVLRLHANEMAVKGENVLHISQFGKEYTIRRFKIFSTSISENLEIEECDPGNTGLLMEIVKASQPKRLTFTLFAGSLNNLESILEMLSTSFLNLKIDIACVLPTYRKSKYDHDRFEEAYQSLLSLKDKGVVKEVIRVDKSCLPFQKPQQPCIQSK